MTRDRQPERIAVVAGPSSMIATACVERLLEDGAHVIAEPEASVEQLVAACADRFDRVDALINCHARSERTSFERTTTVGSPGTELEFAL